MQESTLFQLYFEKERDAGRKQGLEQGLERGRAKGCIEAILDILETRFHPGAAHLLKPSLEAVEDIDRLKQLCQAAAAENLETFMQTLTE